MNKRSATLILLLIMILSLTIISSCTKKEKDKIPRLKIATNAEYPPFEFRTDKKIKGVDIDLAYLLARKLNMEYEIIDIDFDALIPSLVTNKYDMAISAITITDKRKEKVDFSVPYYTANQAIIAHKTSEIKIKEENDITLYKIGVQNGTTGQLHIENNLIFTGKMPRQNLISYASNAAAINDMIEGKIDLVIIDDSAAKGYSRLKPVKTVFIIVTDEKYGVALPKNSPYQDKVNNALKEIMNSEDWIKIISTYL